MEMTIPSRTSRLTRGYLIAIVGTVFWSTTAIFIRYLSVEHQLPALVLAFWRDLFVCLALTGVFLAVNPPRLRAGRRNIHFLALYGLELAVFNSLWTFSVALNGAAVSTVLAYSSAAITALLAWRIFGERLDRTKVVAIGLSILGCALVSGALDPAAWRLNALGILTGLLSGVAFAGYSLFGKASSERGIYPWTAMVYSFGFAALALLAFNLVAALLPGGGPVNLLALGVGLDARTLTGWGVLLLLAVGPTIGGYGLYTVSLTFLPASVANLIATLEPAMTAILAYFLLAERLTPIQLFGSALIICGVILLRLSEGFLKEAPLEIGD
jgi:drug/metabolite transporter (DMT)-like permease